MKGLMKIIGVILGILGLSAKATAKKKAEVKKIDKKVKQKKNIGLCFPLTELLQQEQEKLQWEMFLMYVNLF